MDNKVMVADTDVFVDFLQREGAHVRVAGLLRAGRLAITAVTVFEVWRGLESDSERELARRALRGVRVYPLTEVAAKRAAVLHQSLKNTPVGERDTLIAGVCLSVGRPLLTANTRHFKQVPGLDVVQAR
ncbi:MAG: type II toxin-antitoxin system VapC family toxin [Polyangia bacterium]